MWVMEPGEMLLAQFLFKMRIDSLINDAKICLPLSGDKIAIFPITLYLFATIDYFSSFYAGYNDINRKENGNYFNNNEKKNQTYRMVDFLVEYLFYPRDESEIAIRIFRHKLMHTGEPRPIRKDNKTFYWKIGNLIDNHMQFKATRKSNNSYQLGIGIFQFIEDLREGVFGPKGYFQDLKSDNKLQENWLDCKKEFDSY